MNETLEQKALRIAPKYSDEQGRIVMICEFARRLLAEHAALAKERKANDMIARERDAFQEATEREREARVVVPA